MCGYVYNNQDLLFLIIACIFDFTCFLNTTANHVQNNFHKNEMINSDLRNRKNIEFLILIPHN